MSHLQDHSRDTPMKHRLWVCISKLSIGVHLFSSDWDWVTGRPQGFREMQRGWKMGQMCVYVSLCLWWLTTDDWGSLGLAGSKQRAPFILVGYRLMSHMHLLVHVCVQVCVRNALLEREMLKFVLMYGSICFSSVYLTLQRGEHHIQHWSLRLIFTRVLDVKIAKMLGFPCLKVVLLRGCYKY